MATTFGLSIMGDFLRQFAGEEVLYFPNPGNAGDSLIAAGTYQAFRRSGVRPRVIDDAANVTGKVVFLGGGGNLVPAYGEMRRAVERCHAVAARLIILPHTIRGNEDLLRALPKTAVVFCRDPLSYAHVIENTDAEVYLDHDMAFHLSVDAFQEQCRRYPDAPHLFEKRREEVERTVRAGNGIAKFMRLDGERASHLPELEDNLDLSQVFEFGVWPDNAEKSVYCVFEAIRMASRVVTDRLHISVASGLLGKPCDLFDNNYGKNRGIFYHSTKRFCPSVRFCA
ncbi:polysaccharide pyruvyl transferase family protein [Dankookia sp. GCM10030260]|uniref:polysaccharide pyruvyl transferase family protein n=1 Tax=Dankookia sp. GCM10030260 TaxID=3273390 RepID=UPI003619FC9E